MIIYHILLEFSWKQDLRSAFYFWENTSQQGFLKKGNICCCSFFAVRIKSTKKYSFDIMTLECVSNDFTNKPRMPLESSLYYKIWDHQTFNNFHRYIFSLININVLCFHLTQYTNCIDFCNNKKYQHETRFHVEQTNWDWQYNFMLYTSMFLRMSNVD